MGIDKFAVWPGGSVRVVLWSLDDLGFELADDAVGGDVAEDEGAVDEVEVFSR